MTTTCPLDYSTVAIADKFGNLSLIRLPQSTNDDVEEDPTGTKSLWDRGLLSGAGQKAECIAVTHIGETIVSLTKAALIPGGSDSLVYTTLSGTVGMVVPFTSNEDHDFFQHLEMHMRGENPPMCGRYAETPFTLSHSCQSPRDHLSYRSSYYPCKNVLDGDLCEQFNTMDPVKQKGIAEELDRCPDDVNAEV